ncbi:MULTISPECIES: DUF3048 domain-containing protein [unclassified Isoptericola]|uniref:DUF3048 domain-containing protein n=1 Tax=unclassified Isoptericola TaxID=2623355 RepID=UPI0036597228
MMHRTRARGARRARTGAAAALVALALVATAACSGGEPAAPPTVTASPEVAVPKATPPAPVKPKPKPKPAVWPLTGKRTGTKTVPARPAVAVKVENSTAARPQRGLQAADVVWEQVVEGGISRYVAVYNSSWPGVVGPVRSVRPMDPAIVAPMHGILAYSGGQPPFIRAVGKAGVQSVTMDSGDPGFWRSGDRYAPHNVYGSVKTFAKQANKSRRKPPPPQFAHAAKVGQGSAATNDRRGHVADVRLSPVQRTVWRWKAKTKTYARYDGSTPSISSGNQLRARNVLILSVAMKNTKYRDPSGAPVPETQMVGKGKGVLLTRGKALNVTWKKKGTRSRIALTTPAGKTAKLDPGNLWIELVPRGSGSWRVS